MDNVERKVVEESEREEGSKVVWWIEERGSSFYSNGARPWCGGEVSRGVGSTAAQGH